MCGEITSAVAVHRETVIQSIYRYCLRIVHISFIYYSFVTYFLKQSNVE
ncbi:MAG: hypothetical protein Faunusvirus1_35 [Faunusvirus sp.]|uniref:Uncharacterized protein n=1 Tax=Faunusvirus sp. TaxID=2487766 RepID=A0A3G4ZVU3_9VIRU|nr:MAG: hypothetical protein Faunusvirus1_35 [Faunusvirus sp.]